MFKPLYNFWTNTSTTNQAVVELGFTLCGSVWESTQTGGSDACGTAGADVGRRLLSTGMDPKQRYRTRDDSREGTSQSKLAFNVCTVYVDTQVLNQMKIWESTHSMIKINLLLEFWWYCLVTGLMAVLKILWGSKGLNFDQKVAFFSIILWPSGLSF